MINIQLLRNATQVLTINNKTILIDPMLAKKGSYDPIPNTSNTLRNPTVDLPLTETELTQLIGRTDSILLTHLHADHWDPAAQQLLPKDITLFCQPVDVQTIRSTGFINVIPVGDEVTWGNIRLNRTSGQHGTGIIGKQMGNVSGYVVTCDDHVVYLAGDTIWCSEVAQALERYQPSFVVVNGGGARFVTGDAIVMTIPDVITVSKYAPQAKIMVVHLEAVNHSAESRDEIKEALKSHGLSGRYFVPQNGEIVGIS